MRNDLVRGVFVYGVALLPSWGDWSSLYWQIFLLIFILVATGGVELGTFWVLTGVTCKKDLLATFILQYKRKYVLSFFPDTFRKLITSTSY